MTARRRFRPTTARSLGTALAAVALLALLPAPGAFGATLRSASGPPAPFDARAPGAFTELRAPSIRGVATPDIRSTAPAEGAVQSVDVSAAGTTDWYNLTAASLAALPVLEFTQGAWDAASDQLLTYGGDDYAVNSAATWAYSGENWTEPSAVGLPGPLSGPNLAYDAAASEVVMFGGTTSFSTFASNTTTYTYADGQWSPLNLSPAPAPELYGQMAYDPALGGVVLNGGANLTTIGPLINQTWLFRDGAWTQLHPAASPTVRWMGQMAFDPTIGALVEFGGLDAADAALSDTWAFNGSNWTRLAPAASPPALSDAVMDYDPGLGTLVLTGGVTSSDHLSYATYTFDGTTWSTLSTAHAPSDHDAGIGAFDPQLGAFVESAGSPRGSYTDALSGPLTLQASLPSQVEVGQNATLVANGSGGAPPFVDELAIGWGDGSSVAGSPGTYVHRFGTPGNFPVTVNLTGSGGLSVAWNTTVRVVEGPQLTLALNGGVADVGVPANLTAVASDGAPGLQIQWELGDGSIASGPTLEHTYAAVGRLPVEAWANDSLGGSVEAQGVVNVSLPPTVTLPPGGYDVDAGTSAALSAEVVGGSAPLNISWFFPDGTVGNGTVVPHTFESAGTTSLTVDVTDAAGAREVASAPVTVAPGLGVRISGPPSATLGVATTWNAVVTGGTAPFHYAWNLSGAPAGGSAAFSHIFTGSPSTPTVTLTVTDAANATATATENVSVGFSTSSSSGALTPLESVGLLAIAAVACAAAAGLYLVRRKRTPPSEPATG